MKSHVRWFVTGLFFLSLAAGQVIAAELKWSRVAGGGMPAEWYSSEEGLRVADNILLFQRDTGGWPKDIEMAQVFTDDQKKQIAAQKKATNDSTIDNMATTSQIKFLAKMYAAKPDDRYKDAVLRGLDYLLAAQYENGGWPQVYPNPQGYAAHITFNDDAMINVLQLLRDVFTDKPEYAVVDQERKVKAKAAFDKAIACILKLQIRVNGKLTAWCAQHDEKTFAPAPARSYEHASISGSESVPIVRFLMSIEPPTPEIIDAVQSAVAWFQASKIEGIKVVDKADASLQGGKDRVVVEDPTAPPIWARFYDISTNKPIFSGRDGVIKATMAEIEHERRIGYSWYTNRPATLLQSNYPAWQAKWAPDKNVLAQ